MTARLTEEDHDVTRCAFCHDQCMSATAEVVATGDQRLVVSRVAALAMLLDSGFLPWTRSAGELLFYGLNDGLQREFCIFAGEGQRIEPYIRRLRAGAVGRGLAPEAVKAAELRVRQTGNVFGREEDIASPRIGPSEILFVHDAATRALNPEVVPSALALIQAFGLGAQELAVASGGLVELEIGYPALARQAAERAAGVINDLHPSAVVTTDPVLAYAFRFAYPYLGVPIESPVLHISEFLERGETPRFRQTATSVVYQDPGALARGLRVVDAPRRLLGAVPGLGLREAIATGSRAASDGPLAVYPDEVVSRLIASSRLRQLCQTGAELVVTASPYSYANLSAVAKGFPILDICSLLAATLADETTVNASARRVT